MHTYNYMKSGHHCPTCSGAHSGVHPRSSEGRRAVTHSLPLESTSHHDMLHTTEPSHTRQPEEAVRGSGRGAVSGLSVRRRPTPSASHLASALANVRLAIPTTYMLLWEAP